MAVPTVIADSNECTVRFREPLGKFQYIKLLVLQLLVQFEKRLRDFYL